MQSKPFPWWCVGCKLKEVYRSSISYQTDIPFKSKTYKISISNLSIPKCCNCSHVIFDFEADDQIDRAFRKAVGDKFINIPILINMKQPLT